jgi:AcrR family transcriptional regulator
MPDARRKILDASIDLVAEQGVRAVSFREAARRAGVSHQTPYHHFGDHRGILLEIAREGFAGLADAMATAGASSPDPLTALVEAGMAYVDFATAHVGHFRVMFQPPGDATPTGIPEAERTHEVLLGLAGAVVAHGNGGGLPVPVLAELCWSTVHGLATLLVEGIIDEEQLGGVDRHRFARQVVEGLAGLMA